MKITFAALKKIIAEGMFKDDMRHVNEAFDWQEHDAWVKKVKAAGLDTMDPDVDKKLAALSTPEINVPAHTAQPRSNRQVEFFDALQQGHASGALIWQDFGSGDFGIDEDDAMDYVKDSTPRRQGETQDDFLDAFHPAYKEFEDLIRSYGP